jgi:predicted transcriptional regulator YdeE
MHFDPVDLSNDLAIVGPSIRTSPATAARDIPAIWRRFMSEGLADRVPSRADSSIYAVYADYESDHRGAYTMVLGVASSADAPAGMRRVVVPAGRYTRFVAKGDPAEVVFETWVAINEEWPERIARRYAADFERYRADAVGPGGVEVEIHVGMR